MHPLHEVLHVICVATLLASCLVSGQESVSHTNNGIQHFSAPEERSLQQRGPYYPQASEPTQQHQTDLSHLQDDAEASLDNLSFKLMNAPRERLQAVQNLVDSQQVQSSPELQYTDQPASPPVMPHCHHKGQQYKHGQSVPIEDQPCLNCTCHRAVLQCYLRVCPPIHSANAERRHLDTSGRLGFPDGATRSKAKCIMHKEPNQCCPTLKCESASADPPAINYNKTAVLDQDAQASTTTTTTTSSTTASHQVNLDTDTVSAAQREPVEERGAASNQMMTPGHVHQMVHNRSIEQSQDTQLQAHQSSDLIDSPTSNVPKLTVINGATGQRDSILLITSNPAGQTTERPMGEGSRGDFSNALIEALLETVYSSGAQLSGLNLEGSCMINGSLYIEGSAVIPEGNAFCQYCYCIRQKIMCVRPKCQLIISGCTPRYSNEYACCPTSYACNQSGQSNSLATRTPLTHRSGSPLEQTTDLNQTQALSARLWSAIESLSKHLGRPTRQNLDLREALEPPNYTTTSTSTTSTTTTTTTTTTTARPVADNTTPFSDMTTTTVADQQRTSTGPVDVSPEGRYTSTEPVDTSTEFGTRINPLPAPAEPVELSERSRESSPVQDIPAPEQAEPPAGSTTSTEQAPSSVSDFLEPMNKLGPLVVSPAAPSSCIENGRHYSIGEQIPTLESCKHCYCGLDGLKECKMVECSLMMGHNCRPITPEGHCCPVRYECPTGSGYSSTGARYRSEPLCTGGPRDGAECRVSGPKIDETPIELNRTSATESLTDELNKFIMRINSPSAASAEASAVSSVQPNTELPPQVSTSPFEPHPQPQLQLKSQEAAINEQNSQIVFQDYPSSISSTQVPTEPFSTGTIQPEGPPTAPSVSSAPGAFSPTTQSSLQTSTTASGNDETSISAVVGGQRDSRSTDSRFQALSELLEEQKRRNQLESSSRTSPEEYSVLDIAQPLAPLDETNHQRFLSQHQKAINHSHMVVFDDELLLPHNLANNTAGPRVGLPAPASEFITGNWIEPTTSTSTEPSNSDSDTSTPATVEPTTSTPLTTYDPTTTGTPFGLVTERSPETRGWLQSLHGLVSSFGRRLAGSTPVSADAPPTPANELQSEAAGLQSSRLTGETARSRSPSLFNQILKSVIGAGEQALVMRPLTGDQLMSTHRSDHMDLIAQPSSGGEIPNAMSSVATETGTETSSAAVTGGETLMSSDSMPQIQIHRMNNNNNNNKLPVRPQPTHASLTCYEPLTNRTYLSNEIIPKDDPCKTCTCVLGEELCQNLVCPEKPGLNCKVEERPGECCPNYLCGNEVLNSAASSRVNQIKDGPPPPVLNPAPQLNLVQQNSPQVEPFSYPPSRRIPLGGLHNLPQRLPAVHNQNQVNNLNYQMKPNLPNQQLRTANNNLANMLPPHLRFRPNNLINNNANQNPQLSLLYNDRNKILFNNQRFPTVPDLNGFNSQRLNVPTLSGNSFAGSPYARNPILLDQFNNRGPTNIRLPVLMHPSQHQQHTAIANMNGGMHQMIPPPLHPLLQQRNSNHIVANTLPFTTTNQPLHNNIAATSQPQLASASDTSSQQQDLTKKPFELTNELQDNNNKERVIFPNQLQPDLDSGFKPISSPALRPAIEIIKPPTTVSFPEVPSTSAEQSWTPDHLSTSTPTTTTTTSTTSTTTLPSSSTHESVEFDFRGEDSNESTDTRKDAPSQSSDNLLSMFRVSECNIYGHIYKVGDIVDSLSDSCKRCTCSSTGVECKNLCT